MKPMNYWIQGETQISGSENKNLKKIRRKEISSLLSLCRSSYRQLFFFWLIDWVIDFTDMSTRLGLFYI